MMNCSIDPSPMSDVHLINDIGRGISCDLSLKDFEDEDLSDILHDKDLQLHSYANDSFKVTKRRSNSSKCKSRIQVDREATSHRPHSIHETIVPKRFQPSRRPRPTSLRFFAEPARPGPLPPGWNEAIRTKVQATSQHDENNKKTDGNDPQCNASPRLTSTYSDDTIKNNNVQHDIIRIARDTQTTENSNEATEEETNCRNPPMNNTNIQTTKNCLNREVYPDAPVKPTENLDTTVTLNHEQRRYRCAGLTRSASEWSIDDPDKTEYCYINGEMKEQTHTASFKFVPRHRDEIQLEINDPLHVTKHGDDFWCEGINMRSGEQGIFPAYYAQSMLDDVDQVSEYSSRDDTSERFNLYFLGSVEVPCHKGNDVLCQAMHKVAQARRITLHKLPPAYVCLLVSSSGIKMMDQSQLKRQISNEQDKSTKHFSSSTQVKERTHFFQLRNVSFCGHHPKNDKYFAFITRHPDSHTRFACHVFVSENATRPLAESVGRAFASFYREFMECTHPVEDIYIE